MVPHWGLLLGLTSLIDSQGYLLLTKGFSCSPVLGASMAFDPCAKPPLFHAACLPCSTALNYTLDALVHQIRHVYLLASSQEAA